MTATLPQKIAFIGVGSMGSAILHGLLQHRDASLPPVRITTGSAASAAKWESVTGVSATASEVDPAANRSAVAGAGLIVLGVKPWLIGDVLADISDSLTPGAVVVSVAAGVPLAAMRKKLGRDDVALVRAMPNTPALIGKGVTGLAMPAGSDPQVTQLAQQLFAAVGEVLVVPEDRIDAVAAVSGSGPAYLFWFVEEFIAAAERAGFNTADATLLAQQTVTGAAALLERSDKSAAELRQAVTSPKGTTEQALIELGAGGFAAVLDRALAANMRRSQELAAAAD